MVEETDSKPVFRSRTGKVCIISFFFYEISNFVFVCEYGKLVKIL